MPSCKGTSDPTQKFSLTPGLKEGIKRILDEDPWGPGVLKDVFASAFPGCIGGDRQEGEFGRVPTEGLVHDGLYPARL